MVKENYGKQLIISYFKILQQKVQQIAIGIFYIIGQLFVNALQLIIVPMVFVSITLAICTITDTKKLGRISSKTILTFFTTTVCALIFAGAVSTVIYHLGLFNTVDAGKITVQQGTTGSNPLNIIVSIIPNNFISAFLQQMVMYLLLSFSSCNRFINECFRRTN